ncbi:MAG TPA: FhaA domain-containing protein [Candidatus Baltobacteraceae bacterium]
MSWLFRIEQACAAFIERAFAKSFPSDLEPAQIARKLVATMEAATRTGDDGLLAPGSYRVYVNPDDLERLAPHAAYLEREWAQLLADMAARVDVGFSGGGVAVRMEARPSIPAGAVDIEADVPSSSTRYVLRMLSGVSSADVYPVDGALRVGRADDSELKLADPSVSRRHAVVDLDRGAPFVRDLGSRNGTFVNGERIHVRRLSPGDLVVFGKTEMRLEGA